MCENSTENQQNFTNIRKEFLRHLSINDNVTSLSHQFSLLISNHKRVDFVLELLKSSKIEITYRKDTKNDEIAIKMREEGNEMFKKKKLKEAWELYTKSICFAEKNSVNLGLAYANRSAVLFESNLHTQCVMDIGRALNNSYPNHLKQKLFVREKNCKNCEFEDLKKVHEEIPTVTNQNPKIQSASDCLKIEEDENYGRYVVAAKDIKVGDVLAVEKPFTSLLVNQFLDHCHECINLCYNPIPCDICTQVVYCSENCKEQALNNYHKYECPILATIRLLEFDKLKILPLKIAFLASEVSNFKHNNMYCSDSYKEVHELISNCEKRSVSDLFERALAAAIIYNLVKDYTNFFLSANLELEKRFKEILLLHMQTGPSNFHEITELCPNSLSILQPEEIASGVYPFLSLLNHSCSPNVTRFCYGSTLVLRAIENIKKGEQCFDNYGYHFAVMCKSERQKHLQNQYYFSCVCQACVNNWPMFDSLPTSDNFTVDEIIMQKLSTGDMETAKSVLQELLEKLTYLQELQPCRGFCQVQEAIKQCFAIFGNKRLIF